MDKRDASKDLKAAASDVARDYNHTVPDAMAVAQFQTMFKKYANLLEWLENSGEVDVDTVRGARFVVAKQGLSLSQKVLPALSELADELLEKAGKDAVRAVCAPMIFKGDNGEILREAASGFDVPPGFEQATVAGVISKTAKSAGAAVAGIAVAAITTISRR